MKTREEKNTISIRRENKNKWERRVALIPEDCKILIQKGIKIIVQPSKLRCFTDKQYEDVGCQICEDIEQGSLIIGVKEVPLEFLFPEKTFMYFSHTLKGQPANMPALKDILDKKIRLIDYECIKEKDGQNPQRLVAFGRYAGLAGAVDFLQGIGEFLLNKQIFSPFINTGYSYMFPSVADAKVSVERVGTLLQKKLLPKEICPFIVGFTSNGRVSKGAQEILQLLPHEYVDPEKLDELFVNPRRDIVYLTVIESKNMYEEKSNKKFSKEDFYANPGNYKSTFGEKFLTKLSILYHCMFWGSNHPKVITLEESHDLSSRKEFRLLGICDITCDLGGSSELLQKLTTIEKPFYSIDPLTNIINDDFSKMSETSILYHAVDHLPAEFPIDASEYFSERLTPFIEKIVASEYPCDLDSKDLFDLNPEMGLPTEIFNACETWNGKLMPKYEYLHKELAKYYQEFSSISRRPSNS